MNQRIKTLEKRIGAPSPDFLIYTHDEHGKMRRLFTGEEVTQEEYQRSVNRIEVDIVPRGAKP